MRWIVVGAGSAGCVVAARLVDRPGHEVVLVESGPGLAPADVPTGIDSDSFFDALTEPGRVHLDVTARHFVEGPARLYLRGRGVGGSSAVNAMIALRGDPDRYRSWGWDDVDEAWARVELPLEHPADSELGAVDRALLAAARDAERALLTRRDGRRVTSAEALLWPRLDAGGLSIRPDVAVARVALRGRRAVGVETVDGELIDGDRVVLCAGAIHSPAILLRSGVDTPGVGTGLQDHAAAPLTLTLRDDAVADPSALVVGSLLSRGPLQFLPMNHLGPTSPGHGLLMVALMRPRGRAGSVRLRDDDPLTEPVVDFALLADPWDLQTLAAGVREALDLVAAEPFRSIVEKVSVDTIGTPASTLDSRDAIVRWLRTSVGDYVHASSSCPMGTVVDGDGAVVGYDDLFVCDASVFPEIPDVNTHLPTTMLAERLTARWLARR